MDVFKVWVPLREHLSVQALYGTAIALYWKISERQNSTHMAFLKPKNTKTSLYKLSKNGWVCAFFDSVREILQFTVLLDHPVTYNPGQYNSLTFLQGNLVKNTGLTCIFIPESLT